MSSVAKCFVGWAGQIVVLWKDCQWTKKEVEKELRAMKKGRVGVIEVSPKEFREIERERIRIR